MIRSLPWLITQVELLLHLHYGGTSLGCWLKKWETQREKAKEREIWSLCTVADCKDKPFVCSVHSLCVVVFSSLPEKFQTGRIFQSFKSVQVVLDTSQTHPHTNTPINIRSLAPFVPQALLKKGCHLTQKPLLCHYCVVFNGEPSNSPFTFLFPFFVAHCGAAESLKRRLIWPCHTQAAIRSLRSSCTASGPSVSVSLSHFFLSLLSSRGL